jgi:coatomer subunit beta
MLGDAFDAIRGLSGDPPFTSAKDLEDKAPEDQVIKTKNVVLSDGTYASVTSVETTGAEKAESEVPHLRKLIGQGDILLGTVTCASLTKISLSASTEQNRFVMGSLLTIAGVGKLAEVKRGSRMGVYADCLDRLTQFCRVLLDPALQTKLKPILLDACQEAYNSLVSSQKAIKNKANEEEKKGRASNPDDLIQFRQLRVQSVQGGIEVDLMDADDISRAIGSGTVEDAAKLRHVYQLTGFSDPVSGG